MVIAAGSVMNEPRSGTSDKLRKYPAIAGCSGSRRPTERTLSDEDAKKIYPQGWRAPRPYLRFVPQPQSA